MLHNSLIHRLAHESKGSETEEAKELIIGIRIATHSLRVYRMLNPTWLGWTSTETILVDSSTATQNWRPWNLDVM